MAVAPLGEGKKATVRLHIEPPPPLERLSRWTARAGLALAVVLAAGVILIGV